MMINKRPNQNAKLTKINTKDEEQNKQPGHYGGGGTDLNLWKREAVKTEGTA